MKLQLITAIALGVLLAAGHPIAAQENPSAPAGVARALHLRPGAPGRFSPRNSSRAPIPLTLEAPATTSLGQNYPNPFSAETHIGYQIAEPGEVHLVVCDATGQEIRTLVSDWQDPGAYEMAWSGDDDYGQWVDGGTYYCVFTAGGYSDVMSMTVAK